MKLDAVVVLNTMWDWENLTTSAGYKAVAPRWFSINPNNKSGKLLYYILGTKGFVVTNACKELVTNPNQQGKQDPVWLANNLRALYEKYQYKMILVCGKPANSCFTKCNELLTTDYKPPKMRVIKLKHPAARDWTKQEVERWRKYLEK